MRLLLSILLMCFCLTLSHAQNNLSGKISTNSGESFEYCKLILLKDSIVVKTVETDSLGNYTFQNISHGDFQLCVKIPFKTIDTLLTISGNTTFDLAVENESKLDDVVIVAKRQIITRKVDRTIFDPTSIPVLKGGDASDVIEFAPGVYIDGESIHVVGGSSAHLMMNDKLIPLDGASLISFIRSIPTEDIQYIEIIPIPPVKYAASVNGSLINIKLVAGAKSRLSKGSVTADVGQKFYSQQGISGNYAYRKNKFSLYTTANFYNGTYRFTTKKTIDYDTLLWLENEVEKFNSKNVTGSIGLNYELNSTTEIGILAVERGRWNEESIRNFIEKKGNTSNSSGIIENLTSEFGNNLESSVNINLSKRLDSLGKKIDFNIDYTNINGSRNLDFNTRAYNSLTDSVSSINNQKTTLARFLSGGIDFVQPLKKAKMNMGFRYSNSIDNNNLLVYNNLVNPTVADTSQSNLFKYNEQIQAAYWSIDWTAKRWSFQLGLRGENTIYIANSPTSELKYKNHYFQFLPKAFAMYETKNGTFWNFNYSRDFSRPSYSELNPFRYYTSAYSFRTGNPYLKPVFFNDFSVSTNIKDFQFNLRFSVLNNMTTSVTIYDPSTQIQQTTVSNLFNARSVDFSINYFKIIKKRTTIDLSTSFMLMNRTVVSTIANQNLNNFSGFAYLSLNQTLDKKETFFLQATMYYYTPYLEQISLTSTKPRIDFKFKKVFLKNRMTLELAFTDPFRLQIRKSETRSNKTIVYQSTYYDSQAIVFSFRFKIGNNKLNVNQHNTNSTGEAGRAGS